MAEGSVGMSGHNFDAFVSRQRNFNDHDLAAKIQEKYWRARQKFLSKIEKKEDACIVLSDSKLDSKLEVYRSIDRSSARLTNILEDYQNYLYVYANEENSLGSLLRECGKHDKTKAGKIMSITGKSLNQSSHKRIKLYLPLMRIYQEMETFHSRAVDDTAETVQRLEDKRDQYRASLLWMKDISERLNPDVYRQLDKFRRVQNQVRVDKKAFDSLQMDVVQKIDLLMASRCNLMNQILASYQETLLDTFEKNYNNFRSIEELLKKEDIYEYEFKALKQLNPLKISDDESPPTEEKVPDLLQESNVNDKDQGSQLGEENVQNSALIDFFMDEQEGKNDSEDNNNNNNNNNKVESKRETVELLKSSDTIEQLEQLFGKVEVDPDADQDLMGEEVIASQNSSIDLLTNELDDIDNSSYFKSLQRLQL